LQRLELLDGLAVTRVLHGLLGPSVDRFGARSGIVGSMAAAAGAEERHADGKRRDGTRTN
jgi:hypothetical protein